MFKKIHYALNWVSRKKVVCKVIFDQLVSYSVTKPDLGPVHHLRWKNSRKEHYLDVAGVLDQPLSQSLYCIEQFSELIGFAYLPLLTRTLIFILLGKTSVITKFQKSRCLQNIAATFLKNSVTREEIGKAGVEMFKKR